MGRLFWKIFISLWLTLLVTGAIVGGLVWQHNKQRIENLEVLADGPRAYFSVKSLARVLRHEGLEELDDVLEDRRERTHRPLKVLIVNPQGEDVLGRPVPPLMLSKAREALNDSKQASVKQVTTPEGETFLLFVPRREYFTSEQLYRGANDSYMHHKKGSPALLPPLPLFIMFLASLIFSAGLAWYITSPIRHLRKATNRFAEGKLDTRVMPAMGKRRDEITQLAKDFDHMAEQVQQLIATQKRLLNDVSHELRSPLARLQVAIEMGRQQPEKINELMQRIEKESQRLDELVGELLTLSRLEADIHQHEHDYFDINGLVESISEDVRFEASNQNKQLELSLTEEMLMNGSIELLRRAIENVMRNAVFYTPEHSQVDIKVRKKSNSISILVCDSGKGVSDDKLADLFQPFVRINESHQNIKVPGFGLGLAIARRAIELHGGDIQAYNREGAGLCIEMSLPI